MPRNEDRHRYPGHYVRIPGHVWDAAAERARGEGTGVRDLVHGWLAAYAAGALGALRIADNDPAHEGAPMSRLADVDPVARNAAQYVADDPTGERLVGLQLSLDVPVWFRTWLDDATAWWAMTRSEPFAGEFVRDMLTNGLGGLSRTYRSALLHATVAELERLRWAAPANIDFSAVQAKVRDRLAEIYDPA